MEINKKINEYYNDLLKNGKIIPLGEIKFPSFSINDKDLGQSYQSNMLNSLAKNVGKMGFKLNDIPIILANVEKASPNIFFSNALANSFVDKFKAEMLYLDDADVKADKKEGHNASAYIQRENKLIATAIMIKKEFPNTYNTLKDSLRNGPNFEYFKTLQDRINNPDAADIKIIYDTNPEFVKKHFNEENQYEIIKAREKNFKEVNKQKYL